MHELQQSFRKFTLKLSGIWAIALCVCLLFSGHAVGQNIDIVSAETITDRLEEERILLHFAPDNINVKSRDALNKIISIDFTNVPMEIALQKIAGTAGLKVAYSKDVAPSEWDKPVTVQYDKATVLGGLYQALGNSNLRLILSSDSENSQLVVKKGEVNEILTNDKLTLQETITGRVTDAETGNPIPGVTIVIQGTTTGTTTDVDGNFELTTPDLQQTLVISFIGYSSQTVPLDGRTQLDIELAQEIVGLEDVVVTAIGLERDRRSVGYAITQVNRENLVEGTEANMANLLQGQVAGVHITPTGGGAAASTRVVIRGASSLTGDNQPLYVIDGVPIDNRNIGSAGMWGGTDGGDGISSINPADIENISVLKGASAAALYGERARDGVILITTRRGEAGQVSVNFSSNITYERARVNHDYQTQYGQGSGGLRPLNQQGALQTNINSWGEPFDGAPTIQWDGVERPYEDLGSKVDEFYQADISMQNNLSLMGGTERSTYYASVSRLDNQGLVPGAGHDRTSIAVRTTSSIGNLTADLRANYINEHTVRKGWVSDVPSNVHTIVNRAARNVPLSSFAENFKDPETGREVQPTPGAFLQNPYWVVNEADNISDRDRIIGHVRLDYQFNEWLSATGRTGMDWYTLRRRDVDPWGTGWLPNGRMFDDENRVREFNNDFYLSGTYDLSPAISLDGLVGAGLRKSEFELVGAGGSNFIIPGLVTLGNTENQSARYSFNEKEIRSIYGSLDIGFNDYLYLNLTARNDWSSTLPTQNNSFFYPSIGTSFIFSDLFATPDWLSHGQLRASWAEVGSDTDPYQLSLTYTFFPGGQMGQPVGYIGTGTIPLLDLKPTLTEEIELGFDIRFFDDRLGIDFAWYDRKTRNQILSTNVSHATGYGGRMINAGRLDNRGIEFQLTTMPVARTDFFWRSNFNYGRNRGFVAELVEGQEILTLGQSRSQNAWITAQVGEEFGTIRGFEYLRDDDGNIVHENGLPVQGDLTILGRGTPDWTLGWVNRLTFRNWTLNLQVDSEWGGQLFSNSNRALYGNGLHKNTLQGRAACDQNRQQDSGLWATDCFVGEGVDINGGENTTGTTPQAYFGRISSQITEHFVYDKNLVTLRQIQLGYRLPAEWTSSLGIRTASVSLVGRNLFFIYNPIPNIDPNSSINRGNAQGLESESVPHTRQIGFNIEVQF